MASLDLNRYAGRARSLQGNFWRLVPEDLFLPGFFLPAPKVVEIPGLPPDLHLLAAVAKTKQTVALHIDPGACLLRSVTLPKAALHQADSAIALQMRQTLPSAGKGLVWRSALVASKEQTVEFQVFILKQTQLDALIEAFANVGAEVFSIGLSGIKADPFWSARTGNATRRKFWLYITFLLGVLPAIWSIYGLERQVAALNETMETTTQRVSDLQTKLVAARDEANKAESETATLQSDIATFATQTGRLRQMADLTQTLPDSVWVSELTFTGSQLSMSGFSSIDVAEVVTSLQALQWVAMVQLEGPISLDSLSGQNRFQLGIRIKPNEAPE